MGWNVRGLKIADLATTKISLELGGGTGASAAIIVATG